MKRVSIFLAALCRIALACIFWLAMHLSASLTICTMKNEPDMPQTYLGMMHKRDTDPLVLLPTVLFRRGWKGLVGAVCFALRGDGFSKGYLARIVVHPDWLARLLHPISVGPILRWLGTYRTEGLMRPVEEWLREIFLIKGDVLTETILSPIFLQKFARAADLPLDQVCTLTLSEMLAWRYHPLLQTFSGPEMVLAPTRRHLERRLIERIHAQIGAIVAYFWQGGTILGSPEGLLSPDGHISSLHTGFQRIIGAAPRTLRVVPIAIMYDFMTTRRQRIFVDFAPAIAYAPGLAQSELAVRLRQSWLRHAHFTCTQLASGFLMECLHSGKLEFTYLDLSQAVYEQACKLAAAGRHVDPRLLRLSSSNSRVQGYLAFCKRSGLLQRTGENHWKITFEEQPIQVGPHEVAYNKQPLHYAYNELLDLTADTLIERA